MNNHSGRYVIIYNGEIFNFKELSERYLQKTWADINGPRTSSDTEVLLYLLIEYGTECLKWLQGFFAFAFYDRENGEMLIARDRFGKKPLLYYHCTGYLAFASEMKSLLAWDIPKELNYNTLFQYLQLNYVPPAESMLSGVSKLKPGTWLRTGPSGNVETGNYYQLEVHRKEYGKLSYEQAQKRLIELMDDSVKDRLISDVPLGSFLSGGIDSSVIVALATRHTKHLRTFSVGYKENAFFDETHYANLVAKKFQTEHTVFSLANNDFLEHLYEILDYIDEPFADSSAIPMYILCRQTKKEVTVALSGDGGDEVFSGYNKHAAEWKAGQSSFANHLVNAGLPLWRLLPQSRNNKLTNLFRQLRRFAEASRLPADERYWNWALINGPELASSLLSKSSLSSLNKPALEHDRRDITSGIANGDFNNILLADMKLVLTGDMLVKVDQMSMANSLEVRCPFLDYRVVEFAFGLPPEYKIGSGMKKRVLQDAFRKILPEELYNRPKHGFEIPLLGWLRKELWSLIDEDLLAARFVAEQGIFDVSAVEALKAKLKSSNPENSHAAIWALLVFQYWWRKYLVD